MPTPRDSLERIEREAVRKDVVEYLEVGLAEPRRRHATFIYCTYMYTPVDRRLE